MACGKKLITQVFQPTLLEKQQYDTDTANVKEILGVYTGLHKAAQTNTQYVVVG